MIPVKMINRCLTDMLNELGEWKISESGTVSAVEKEVMLGRARVLYQMILQLETTSLEELEEELEEAGLPDVEVEFDYQGGEDFEEDDFEEEEEESGEVTPGEMPLCREVEQIEAENQEPEIAAAEVSKCEEKEEENREKVIEMVAAEIETATQVQDLIDTPIEAEAEVAEVKVEAEWGAPCCESVELFGQKIPKDEKQRFIDHLFGGDAEKFEREVMLLGDMGDLNDALIHISVEYHWHGDNESAQDFIALLDKYFEN